MEERKLRAKKEEEEEKIIRKKMGNALSIG